MKSLFVASLLAMAVAATAVTARAEEPKPAAPGAPAAAAAETKVIIGVVPAVMQFDKKAFSVKAGDKVSLLFTNKACPLQHNLIIVKPGTDAKFGMAADKMITTDAAAALAKVYVPDDAESKAAIVAASTKLIGTGQNEIITFTAPSEPGAYPYLCTFPGHRFLMKGVMTVTE
jgi:azurin